jgi:sugar lactone lactonase YvrE
MTVPCRIIAPSILLSLAAQFASAEEAWVVSGLKAPESVVFDAENKALYVSNIVGEPAAKDGEGFISKLSMDGEVDAAGWVTGLHAPKGMVLSGGTLYVTDIDRLIAIDVAAGKVTGSWAAEGAQFLNDPAVDEQGRVFASDMLADRIYVLEGDSLSVWLEDQELQHPNGLAVEDGQLIVAAWGRDIQPDFTTKTPGHLLTIDLESKAIASYGSGQPIGNLDGLEPDGQGGWLVTDWIGGALYRVQPDGSFEQLLDLAAGSADLEYVADENLALIPMMLDGTLTAQRIE